MTIQQRLIYFFTQGKTLAAMLILLLLSIMVGVLLSSFSAKRDYDCSDFRSQRQAQRVFARADRDIYGLDIDGDGIACESLP